MSRRLFLLVALAVAVGLAAGLSPAGSSSPDGLERVASDQGFQAAAERHPVQDDAPLAGYAVPGIPDERVATGLAGFIGTLAVFGAGYGVARLARRRAPGGAPAAGR